MLLYVPALKSVDRKLSGNSKWQSWSLTVWARNLWQHRSQTGSVLFTSWSYTFGLASNTVVPAALQRSGRI